VAGVQLTGGHDVDKGWIADVRAPVQVTVTLVGYCNGNRFVWDKGWIADVRAPVQVTGHAS
jgi:hypothetical protein